MFYLHKEQPDFQQVENFAHLAGTRHKRQGAYVRSYEILPLLTSEENSIHFSSRLKNQYNSGKNKILQKESKQSAFKNIVTFAVTRLPG